MDLTQFYHTAGGRQGRPRRLPGRRPASLLLLLTLALASACGRHEDAGGGVGGEDGAGRRSEGGAQPAAPEDPTNATFVGRETCAGCHPRQHELWRGSHHDLAMQEATEATVLGDFDDATFTYAGTTSTFLRRDGGFFVRTDGPDGALHEYRVAYAFGVEPLQQYLIAFPDGRYQALSVVWDSRPAADGGQRWFHLYPDDEVDHRDPLHWTGVYQNWNQQCAECHSTNLVRGYDLAADAYDTTWSEIDVSCEACHGPGSAHAAWAEKVAAGEAEGDPAAGLAVRLKDESGGDWLLDAESGIPARSAPLSSSAELETCAPCHARRGPLTERVEPGRQLLDGYRLALLDDDLYHADGQILDEVYVYGSFVQSRMHRAGVTCGDCHDPHALAVPDPDASCARCHLNVFATPEHHFHAPGSAGASCVACHMPARDYMVVDARRDHSFRVPRPDLALELGTPDACSGCHAERGVEWTAAAFARWYGDVDARRPHFARALDAGRRGLPEARRLLAEAAADPETPAIARATAYSELRRYAGPAELETLRAGAEDPDPLVRLGAARAAEGIAASGGAGPRWLETMELLLGDPVRAVRVEAARVLSALPPEGMPAELRPAFDAAFEEYVAAQQAIADRPEGRVHLGTLAARQGRFEDAERQYEKALDLDPSFVPAYVNLADLYRATGRDADGERLLRDALLRLGDAAALRHVLGLALVRQGRHGEALPELERAAELAPGEPRFAYVYAIALHSGGDLERALEVLADAHRRHPADPQLLSALATIHQAAGHLEPARDYARKLLALRPEDPGARRLAAQLGV